MKTLQKNWAFITIGVVSLLLGGLAILTAMRLRTEEPIAPTAPKEQQALEGDPVPACQLTFALFAVSPTPTASPVTCNNTCTSSTQCSGGLTCYIETGASTGMCRNSSCQLETDCTCNASPTPSPSISPTPTPTPTATPIVTPSPTPTATPSSCNVTCTASSQCTGGLTCYVQSGQTSGVCRHPSCQLDADCSCPDSTPAPTATPTPSPSTTPTVPTAGTSWPTLLLIAGGMLLLVVGLVF